MLIASSHRRIVAIDNVNDSIERSRIRRELARAGSRESRNDPGRPSFGRAVGGRERTPPSPYLRSMRACRGLQLLLPPYKYLLVQEVDLDSLRFPLGRYDSAPRGERDGLGSRKAEDAQTDSLLETSMNFSTRRGANVLRIRGLAPFH